MAGFYRSRHPERTILYRVLFHHFERFLAEYEGRFEKEYGYFRPTEYAVVDRIIDHLKLRFVAAKPPPCHIFEQVALAAVEEPAEYFS